MDENMKPARVIPMHEIVIQEMKAREWSLWDLATLMEYPYVEVVELCTGVLPMSDRLSTALGKVFGTSPEFWENLYWNYVNWSDGKAGK